MKTEYKFEIGNLVICSPNKEIGVIISNYKGHGNFDYEILVLSNKEFIGRAGVSIDCFKQEELKKYKTRTIWDLFSSETNKENK